MVLYLGRGVFWVTAVFGLVLVLSPFPDGFWFCTAFGYVFLPTRDSTRRRGGERISLFWGSVHKTSATGEETWLVFSQLGFGRNRFMVGGGTVRCVSPTNTNPQNNVASWEEEGKERETIIRRLFSEPNRNGALKQYVRMETLVWLSILSLASFFVN